MTARRTASVLGAATGALLLGSVAVRLVQDSRLLGSLASDPLTAALLAIELVVLGLTILLGVACMYVARRAWTGRMQRRLAPAIVYGTVLVVGLLLTVRGGTGAFLGGSLAVLSGATLFFQFSHHPKRSETSRAA